MKSSLLFSALIVCVLVLSACTTPASDSSSTSPANDSTAVTEPAMEANDSDMSDETAAGVVHETTVTYDNPAGGDEVGFKVVVNETGEVIDADATVLAQNSTSVTRQTAFKNGIKTAVVGKPLAGLTVDRVGGSSLTSKAFNEWVSSLQP